MFESYFNENLDEILTDLLNETDKKLAVLEITSEFWNDDLACSCGCYYNYQYVCDIENKYRIFKKFN